MFEMFDKFNKTTIGTTTVIRVPITQNPPDGALVDASGNYIIIDGKYIILGE